MIACRDIVHVWVANSGYGGEPVYRPNRQMSAEPLMHVRCEDCGTRTWFTQEQWESFPDADGSE